MPLKYIPYTPITVEGQAVLNCIPRTRRFLAYRDSDGVYNRLQRGMPLYEAELLEAVSGGTKDEVQKTTDTAGEPRDQPFNEQTNNLLLRGDCLSACAYLKDKGITVDLVYIDPPFASGADYAKKVYLRRNPKVAEAIARAEEALELDELKSFEEKMYGDIWRKEDYLNWMWENLHAIKSVMSDTGSIYVHLDATIGHYVKILLDEVFGEENFQREIIWDISVLSGFKTIAPNWIRGHDTIFYYNKSSDRVFNKLRQPHTREYLASFTGEEKQPDGSKRYYLVAHGLKRYRDEVEPKGKPFGDVWDDIMSFQQQPTSDEKRDYATQKPEKLLERIILASTKDFRNESNGERMIVADFFGGSGVTAMVACRLGRNFIHSDVGINSIHTTRDALLEAGASFQILDIQDGVSLFRNPQQTMDKLKALVPGLRNEDSLPTFWEGAIQDPQLGRTPVYIPNLLDHSTRMLDVRTMNRIINVAIPELGDEPKAVIVYYVDIEDEAELQAFIKDAGNPLQKIVLRDLKELLDEIVLADECDFTLVSPAGEGGQEDASGGHALTITRFHSDRLAQKLEAWNQKKALGTQRSIDEGPEAPPSARDAGGKPKKATPFTPITLSPEGLEAIELLSLDCTAASGPWHSNEELKVDKLGFVTLNGKKTKGFWDGAIRSDKKPLRLKVRNIAGDETIWTI